ncbi:MAG: class I SAM-dependent methyltransferase [Rhodospirillales bacterium]
MALSLLPGSAGRVLEIGYGSGIFMPALAARASDLYGIDTHGHNRDVMETLARAGIRSQLYHGSCEQLPFESRFFDAVVAVSALEFIDDLTVAVREMSRVLSPDGVLVVITPARSALADAGLWLLSGRKAEEDFEGGREAVIPALLSHFREERRIQWPMPLLMLYTGLRLRPDFAAPAR